MRKMKIVVILLLAILVMGSFTFASFASGNGLTNLGFESGNQQQQQQQQQGLTNPGFESGNTSGWATANGGTLSVIAAGKMKEQTKHKKATPTPTVTPTPTPTTTGDDISSHYTWNQVVTGGGGWGAIVFESAASPGTLYFKDDISSIYRRDSGATTWKKLNTWGSLPTGYVENSSTPGGPMIDCAANDANRVYMAWDKNLFYSDNKGDNWNLGTISTPINYMDGTENPQPQTGCDQLRRLQRMSVDPNNKDVAYYGSDFDGLFRTTDGGKTWNKVTNGIYTGSTVDFNSIMGGYINAAFDKNGGTVSGSTRSAVVWVSCRGQGIYRSTNGGETFTYVPNQPTGTIYYNDATCNAAGTFFVVSGSGSGNEGKVYKCPRDTTTWTDITPLDCSAFESVTVHPSDQRIWVQSNGFAHAFSSDEGNNWTSFTGGSFNVIEKDCPWYSDGVGVVGKVRFSPNTPDKLYMAYGNGGVMYSTNPFTTNGVIDVTKIGKGIQDLCISKILATDTGKLHLAVFEEAGFTFDTNNLTTPPSASWKTLAGINDGWGLKEGECVAVCESNQNAVVATVIDYETTHARNIRSTDGGASWTDFPGDNSYYLCSGNVAIARNNPLNFLIGEITNTFYWFGTPQYLPQDRPLHVTTDGGQTFSTSNGSNSIHMWGGQLWQSNAQNLCADPNVDNRFVAWSNDDDYVYASTDGGQNFTAINTSRPWQAENGVWAKMFGIPGKSGHFIFCQGAGSSTNAPLWKSTDGGVTWANINANLTNVIMAGVGKTLTGANYPTLYVYGTYNGVKGFYRSSDGGDTWLKIAGKYLPNEHFISNVKDIDGDKTIEGRVYLNIDGNSVVYGDFN